MLIMHSLETTYIIFDPFMQLSLNYFQYNKECLCTYLTYLSSYNSHQKLLNSLLLGTLMVF